MKGALSVLTLAIGSVFFVTFFSTLRPATVAAAVGGIEQPDHCSSTQARPTPACQTKGLAALSLSLAAMVTTVPTDRLPPSN